MAWSNARTRALLKGLRHPHVLRTESAMPALRRHYRVHDDRQALIAAVDAALANDAALKEIVYRCDLNGEDTLGVARSLHFSERQFHRYRSFAIEAIAAEIDRATAADPEVESDQQLVAAISAVDPQRANALLRSAAVATPAQRLIALRVKVDVGEVPSAEDLAGLDAEHRLHADALRAIGLENAGEPEAAEQLARDLRGRLRNPQSLAQRRAAFELVTLLRYQGRRRARNDESAAAVEEMASYAVDDGLMARLVVARAQLAIHDASIGDWRARLGAAKRVVRSSPDVRLLRYLAMVEGYLGYVHGDAELALRNSAAATMAGSHPATALQSEALHARAALALRRPWSRPAWTHEVLPKVWFQAELDALAAFHALAGGDGAEARRLANRAAAHPGAPFAPSIGVWAAAVPAVLDGRDVLADAARTQPDLLVATDLRTLRAVVVAPAAGEI